MFILGCAVEPTRDVSVVQGDPGFEPSDEPRVVEDTGLEPAEICGDPDDTAAPLTGGDVLSPDWCVRMSPETVLAQDTGASFDTGEPIPPPCGFTNLVGALGVAGAPEQPAVLYCDADADGGVRFDVFDGTTLQRTLIAEADCMPDAPTGTLSSDEDGFLALWSGYTSEDRVAVSGVVGVRLDSSGAVVDGPERIELGDGTNALTVAGGVLVVSDIYGGLWAGPMGTRLVPVSLSYIGEGIRSFNAVSWGDGALVAACSEAEVLGLYVLDASGALQAQHALTESCNAWVRPGMATDGDRVLLTWEDGVDGYGRIFDATLNLSATIDLGYDRLGPEVVWTGARWALLTLDGTLSVYDADGEEVGSYVHPDIVRAPGVTSWLRLATEGEQLLVLLVGMDSVPMGSGHVNTFNYVELSRLSLP